MVGGDDRPPVGEAAYTGSSGVDHRLHSEDHPRLQLDAGPRATVVEHLWLLVKVPADAVATELADDREAVAFGKALDRRTDVAQVGARPHSADAAPHRLVGHVD